MAAAETLRRREPLSIPQEGDSRNPLIRGAMENLYTRFTLKEIPFYPPQTAMMYLSREDLAKAPTITELLPGTKVLPKTFVQVAVGNSDLGLTGPYKGPINNPKGKFLPIKFGVLDINVLEYSQFDPRSQFHPFYTGIRISSNTMTDADDQLVSGNVTFVRHTVSGDEYFTGMPVDPLAVVKELTQVVTTLREEYAGLQKQRRAQVLKPSEEAMVATLEESLRWGGSEYAIIGGLNEQDRLRGIDIIFSPQHFSRGIGRGKSNGPYLEGGHSVDFRSGGRGIWAETSFLMKKEKTEELTYSARGRFRLARRNSKRAIRDIPLSIVEDSPFGEFYLNDIRGILIEFFGNFVETRAQTPEEEKIRDNAPIILATSIPLSSVEDQIAA